MDESQKHYAEWKKPYTRVYTVCLHLYKVIGQAKLIRFLKKQNNGCLWGWRVGQGLTGKEHESAFWGNGKVL